MAYLSSEPPRRSWNYKVIMILVPTVIFGLLIFKLLDEKENSKVTYHKSMFSVEKHEYTSPSQFLKPSGTYHKTLLGAKYRIQGSITNTAAAAVYKDVVVEFSFYSKTNTSISSKQVTIYDVFPPNAIKNFDVKVEAPKATDTIGWEVVGAARN